MNSKWNINFFSNSLSGMQHTYSREFSSGWSTSETMHLTEYKLNFF